MSDSRGTGNTKPASGPVQVPGDGPGRWNWESGSRPSTATTRITRRPRGTAS